MLSRNRSQEKFVKFFTIKESIMLRIRVCSSPLSNIRKSDFAVGLRKCGLKVAANRNICYSHGAVVVPQFFSCRSLARWSA